MRIVVKPRNGLLHGNRRVEGDGSAETFLEGRRLVRSVKNWVLATDRLPGVSEGDMPTKNSQRKPGTTRGSPGNEETSASFEAGPRLVPTLHIASDLPEPRLQTLSSFRQISWMLLSPLRPEPVHRLATFHSQIKVSDKWH